ncbi:hypothetical protein [Paraburkholderia sp. J94]|uniref:hypothetical protein n=1 Tax=Paraburkholderia sp. J94 TaxID=2805441 RepID=UPI002AAF29E6|nr:hypothetical protein [Paraburkholderia sp. J94]
MDFGLLLPHLPQTLHTLHPDQLGALERPSGTPPCAPSRLAARWRDLRARVFRASGRG